MGRPIPAFNEREANPKVRDLQDQMKENVDQWNRERERFVAQIQKLEEGRRQWDTERRQLADHAGQLQELTQAQAKIQSLSSFPQAQSRIGGSRRTQAGIEDMQRE